MAQHDSLDLPALVAQGQRYRRAARSRTLRMALILLILMFPSVALTYNVSVPTNQVYRLDASSEWSPFNLPMGNVLARADTLLSGGDGSLWMIDGSGLALSRYRDDEWETFQSFEIGLNPATRTLIAADGEQLWGVNGSDIFHFDGVRWESFSNVLPSDSPLAMAAGPHGVFVVDLYGNLSRFWQGAWKHTTVSKALAGVAPESALYDDSFTPTFIQVPNGTLWLAYQGLWKFSGESWIRAHSDDAWNEANYWLLGATDQAVWYLNGYGIERLDVASGEIDSFSLQSLGLKDGYIWAGALQGERLWVVSEGALHVYDDDGWETVANLPGAPDLSPVELVSDNDGAIYVTMYDYGTALRDSYSGAVGGTLLALLIPLQLIAADLFLRYLPEWLQNHRRWREMQRLVTALPEFDGEPSVSDPFTFGRFLLGFGAQLVWMVIVMAGMTVTLIQVTGTAHLGLAFAIGAGLGYVGARWLIGGQLLVLGDPNTRTNIRLLMHGEYDHLLERNGYLIDRSDAQAARHSNPMWQIYGLLLAGRHAEAMPLLRDNIRTFSSGNFVNTALSATNFGYCLMYLDRIDEALPYFELTAHLVPEMTTGYAALAHYYLKTKAHPARALEMAEVAARFEHRQLISGAIADYGRLGSQMVRARALAVNGRCDEAEHLAERALADRAMKQPVIAASIHVGSGHIALICGEPDKAREHFEQGVALDPNGSEGNHARELLKELAETVPNRAMA